MKYLNIIIIISFCFISLSSCEKRVCCVLPPPSEKAMIQIFNTDSTSFHTNPDFNLDSVKYYKLVDNEFIVEEHNLDNFHFNVDVDLDTLYFSYRFYYDQEIDTTIYISLVPNDIDSIVCVSEFLENKSPKQYVIFNKDTFILKQDVSLNRFKYFK